MVNNLYKNFRIKAKFNNGFSLLELMIAIAVIAILATLATPIYQNHILKAEVQIAMNEQLGQYMRAVNEIYSIYGATTIDEPQLTPYIQAARKDFLSDSTSEWSSTTGVLLNLGNAQIVTAKPLNNPPFNEFGPYVTIAPFTNNDITINGVKWRCTAFGFDSALLPLWCNV